MRFLSEALAKLLSAVRSENGQTLVEYALIVALISIAVIATMILLGGNIDSVFSAVANCLGDPASC